MKTKTIKTSGLDGAALDERAVVDDLGEWLCRDMEKSAAKEDLFTARIQMYAIINDVARRIQFYRDNCLGGGDTVDVPEVLV